MPDCFNYFGPQNPSLDARKIDLEALVLGGGSIDWTITTDWRSFRDFMLHDSVHLIENDVSWHSYFRREVSVELEHLDDGTTNVKLKERFYPRQGGQGELSTMHPFVNNSVRLSPTYIERRLFVNLASSGTREAADSSYENDAVMRDVRFAIKATELLVDQYRTIYGRAMNFTLLDDLIITQLAIQPSRKTYKPEV